MDIRIQLKSKYQRSTSSCVLASVSFSALCKFWGKALVIPGYNVLTLSVAIIVYKVEAVAYSGGIPASFPQASAIS